MFANLPPFDHRAKAAAAAYAALSSGCLFWPLAVIGALVAWTWRQGKEDDWLRSHFQYQLWTFAWGSVLLLPAVLPDAGDPLVVAAAIVSPGWILFRCAAGARLLVRGAGVADPSGIWIPT